MDYKQRCKSIQTALKVNNTVPTIPLSSPVDIVSYIGQQEKPDPHPFICIIPSSKADKHHHYIIVLYSDNTHQIYRVPKSTSVQVLFPLFAGQYSPQSAVTQAHTSSIAPRGRPRNKSAKAKQSSSYQSLLAKGFKPISSEHSEHSETVKKDTEVNSDNQTRSLTVCNIL